MLKVFNEYVMHMYISEECGYPGPDDAALETAAIGMNKFWKACIALINVAESAFEMLFAR
jgi:hypothetical protein